MKPGEVHAVMCVWEGVDVKNRLNSFDNKGARIGIGAAG